MPDPTDVKPEIKPEVQPEIKPEIKPEVKPETKAEAKPEVKAEVKPETPPEKKSDWRDARIAELTAKLNQAKATKVEHPKTDSETEAQFNARVEARAQVLAKEQVAVSDFNERCSDAAKTAKAAHPDFTERFDQVKSVINGKDEGEVTQYNSLLAAALETSAPSELLYDLSGDPGEFRRLMALPPVRMGVELATRAAKLSEPVPTPEPSKLDKPITPVGSRGEHYEGIKPDDPNRGMKLPKSEWFTQRQKQVEAKGLQ